MARPSFHITALLASFILLAHVPAPSQACTAVVFAPGATADGAAYTASSADCLDCDFRLARVGLFPADRPVPKTRDVFNYHPSYPHVVSSRSPTWSEANLQGAASQIDAWVSRAQNGHGVLGTVPEDRRKYTIIEAGTSYGLANSAGVGISESTCIAKFVAAPKGMGGEALLDISELSKIALERAGSAKEVVEMMGGLAEEFGFYGPEWDDEESANGEAGETLLVSDATESWVFHVLPDDTGKSAIWAARRVPAGEVAVVANQFLIRKVMLGDVSGDYLASGNMKKIAVKYGWHDDKKDGKYVDFSKAFSKTRPNSSYASHRVYRVLTMVDPTLVGKLDPYPNFLMDGFPFSVKPQKAMSIHDIFHIFRDHFEGTQWDMTTSAAAEPFGTPERFNVGPAGNMTRAEVMHAGEFGRAISIGRTSYVAVVRSTDKLPAEVGPMIYFSQQQPDFSVFLPVYVATEQLPSQFTRGSLFRHDDESMFWAVTTVSNWVHKYYRQSIGDVREVQDKIEKELFTVDETEAKAAKLLGDGKRDEAVQLLGNFSKGAALASHAAYNNLFKRLVASRHDGFHRENATAVDIKMSTMFYSMPWLKNAQFFSATETGGGDAAMAPVGVVRSKPGVSEQRSMGSTLHDRGSIAHERSLGHGGGKFMGRMVLFMAGIVVGVAGSAGVAFAMKLGSESERNRYQAIQS